MNNEYDFLKIEKKWQEYWEVNNIFKLKNQKNKYYVLEMLPYPSGKIHMGHVRNYTIGDAIARLSSLQGKNVFHPIGWDAFGLPAENAAIERGVHPAQWTYQNIKEMKSQLKMLGLSYDWDTEITTCDKEYYKWNQWLFLQFYEKGLIEKRIGKVNFCRCCKTVLANEQVVDGGCWRCGNLVEKQNLSQWYIKITDYAEKLLSQHELLEGKWPSRVLNMQKSWIGKSFGAKVNFELRGYNETISVFTTRLDTIFGVTYLALAPEHPFIQKIMDLGHYSKEITEFITVSQNLSTDERTHDKLDQNGVFTGFYAIHPLNKKEIPIYIANFVVIDYGTGAVMGVPSHDERDHRFAKKLSIEFIEVIDPITPQSQKENMIFTDYGVLKNSLEFSGLKSKDAIPKLIDILIKKNAGEKTTQYKLRDWLISRQRYWGTPIPIVYCEHCGTVPLKDTNLPLILPDDIEFKVGGNPLTSSKEFMNTTCPLCGGDATRETDTLDTFFDSSWYFVRYIDPHNGEQLVDPIKGQQLTPVDQYIGGIEHATMHLLYARFFYMVLEELGYVKGKEPFKRLITQGMVNSTSYYCKECTTYYEAKEIINNLCPLEHKKLITKMDKMSKSKKNGVDPTELINRYGVDSIRIFTLFAAPIDKDLEWNEKGVAGSFRFLKRFYRLVCQYQEKLSPLTKDYHFDTLSATTKIMVKKFHKTVHKITEQVENQNYQFNTALAFLMESLNTLVTFSSSEVNDLKAFKTMLDSFCSLLCIFAPHLSEECYQLLNPQSTSLYIEGWPTYNKEFLTDDLSTIAIQINGKLKGDLTVDPSITEEELVLKIFKKYPSFESLLKDKVIMKTIFVKGKIINFVVK